MIKIREDRKRGLSGLTSLFISFDYDKNLINVVKSCGTYSFDKNTKEWEVPVSSLSYILDNLTFFDDIELKLMPEANDKDVIKPKLVDEYRTKPFDYQLEGIEFGLNNDKFLLLDAPGLGKSLQLIYLAEELKASKGIEHCLVICGIATLRANWRKEINRHSKLSCMILGAHETKTGNITWDSVQKRAERLMDKIDEFFIIVNIESLRDDRIIDALQKGPNKIGMIVFDEAHKAKGWSSAQGKNLLKLTANHVVAATGTLLTNNPVDAYVPLVFVGKEPKNSVTKFKSMYCVFDQMTRGRIIGYKNIDALKDEIDSCSLRRTKDMLDLPERTFIDEYLTMDKEQSSMYFALLSLIRGNSNDASKWFNKETIDEMCDKVSIKASNMLSLIVRLKQATTCPSTLTSSDVTSCKLERAVELVEEIVGNGEKVVIFSTFKEPVYRLRDALIQYSPLIGTGDMSDAEVSDNIDEFQMDPSKKVFIGTISKMGTGVTLTSASYMIFVDQPWTASDYLQACDRIHRIGAKKPVFVYNLICDRTIDSRISKTIERKRAMSDYIIDDKSDKETLEILQDYIAGIEEC